MKNNNTLFGLFFIVLSLLLLANGILLYNMWYYNVQPAATVVNEPKQDIINVDSVTLANEQLKADSIFRAKFVEDSIKTVIRSKFVADSIANSKTTITKKEEKTIVINNEMEYEEGIIVVDDVYYVQTPKESVQTETVECDNVSSYVSEPYHVDTTVIEKTTIDDYLVESIVIDSTYYVTEEPNFSTDTTTILKDTEYETIINEKISEQNSVGVYVYHDDVEVLERIEPLTSTKCKVKNKTKKILNEENVKASFMFSESEYKVDSTSHIVMVFNGKMDKEDIEDYGHFHDRRVIAHFNLHTLKSKKNSRTLYADNVGTVNYTNSNCPYEFKVKELSENVLEIVLPSNMPNGEYCLSFDGMHPKIKNVTHTIFDFSLQR